MIDDFTGLGARSVRVVQELRKEITDGIFTPGSKLPTENELCRRFGITRPTVRRGIAKLVDEGLITVRNGAGMFVNTHDAGTRVASGTISVMYPFDSQSLGAIQSMAADSGHLLCAYSQMDWYWDPERERRFLEGVKRERRKALIAFCSPRQPTNDDLLEEISSQGTRVVHIEPYTTGIPRQGYILPDYRLAAHIAMTKFLIAGYRQAYVVSMGGAPYEHLLLHGAAEALSDHTNRAVDPDSILLPLLLRDKVETHDAMSRFLAGLTAPAAFLCCTPNGAELLIELARERGLRVPGDVGVIAVWHDDHQSKPTMDHLLIEHLAMVRDAIEAVTQPAWQGVRRLVKPRWVNMGTVWKEGLST